jgi:hypothetical protein
MRFRTLTAAMLAVAITLIVYSTEALAHGLAAVPA